MSFIPKLKTVMKDGQPLTVRKYGCWAGKPNGTPEDPSLCIVEVGQGWLYSQCRRKRGHGYNGLLCKQHSTKFSKEDIYF